MKKFGIALTLAGSLLVARAALAGDGCPAPCGPAACGAACGSGAENCCSVCGRHCACVQKVCKLECGTQTVIKHVWRVVCEEFCPLLPGCKECEECCDKGEKCPSSGCCEKCCKPCKGCAECKQPEMVTPKCGHSRVKKRFIRLKRTSALRHRREPPLATRQSILPLLCSAVIWKGSVEKMSVYHPALKQGTEKRKYTPCPRRRGLPSGGMRPRTL